MRSLKILTLSASLATAALGSAPVAAQSTFRDDGSIIVDRSVLDRLGPHLSGPGLSSEAIRLHPPGQRAAEKPVRQKPRLAERKPAPQAATKPVKTPKPAEPVKVAKPAGPVKVAQPAPAPVAAAIKTPEPVKAAEPAKIVDPWQTPDSGKPGQATKPLDHAAPAPAETKVATLVTPPPSTTPRGLQPPPRTPSAKSEAAAPRSGLATPPPPAKAEAAAPRSGMATPPPPAKAEPATTRSSTGGGLEMRGSGLRMRFPAGEATLPEGAQTALEAVANRLEADPQLYLQLLAYAEGTEDEASKARRLSLSRALAVRSYLMNYGVRSTRIEVRALGHKVPDGPADRVDLIVDKR